MAPAVPSNSIVSHDAQVLSRARRISRLSVPYDVAYRLFVSLVLLVTISLLLLVIWALRNVLLFGMLLHQFLCLSGLNRFVVYSLVTPGHLLSPDFFLNYRVTTVIWLSISFLLEILLQISVHAFWTYGIELRTVNGMKRGSCYFGFYVEDPFVSIFSQQVVSVDEFLPALKHRIRNSYRQTLLRLLCTV